MGNTTVKFICLNMCVAYPVAHSSPLCFFRCCFLFCFFLFFCFFLVPNTVYELTDLRRVNFSHNQISDLTQQIGKCPSAPLVFTLTVVSAGS